jgi:hypothetical protein
MLGNTEGAIKNEQCRETGNIGYTRRKKTKQNTTQCVGHQYVQTNTINRSLIFFAKTSSKMRFG